MSAQGMVDSLQRQVAAAREEFDMAIAFHRVWKPSAYDPDLFRRMGSSYASQAFLVIRTALLRETLMALLRLWDTHRGTVRLDSIRNMLRDPRVIDQLADISVTGAREDIANYRAFFREQVKSTILARVTEAVGLIDEYTSQGEREMALANLKRLRNTVLAHRQVKQEDLPEETATGEQIERFMTDTSKLIGLLMGIAHATAYDPEDTALVYDRYAESFWASAKGERTEGHPDYRPQPNCGSDPSASEPSA